MKKEEIKKALAEGNYEVSYENECDCQWDHDNRYMDCETALHFGGGNECWAGGVLWVGGEPIAECVDVHEFRRDVVESGLSEEDIPEEIWAQMCAWEQNELHEERKRETLVEWIEEHGYSCYRQDGRFANEYHLYLTLDPEGFEDETEDLEAYSLTPQDWVEDYFRYPTPMDMDATTARIV